MKIAIYPGSFDPITLGHLDIIRRGAACFDKLYVCVMVNCEKKLPMFTPERRLELIRRSVADIPNVEVENWSGLLAGVNIGGLGTPIASLASLISLRFYLREPGAKGGRYLLFFTLAHLLGLCLLLPLAAWLG